MAVMKTILTSVALAAAVVGASAESATAQWYSGTPYSAWRSPVYGYSPYYGRYAGRTYYPGGYGVQTFSYDATLPGGGVYGYSYRRPGYYAAYRSPSFGYSRVYPGYYYRPGYYIWFNN